MKNRKIIMFCGHREISHKEQVVAKLNTIISKFCDNAKKNSTELVFFIGGYGDFDELSLNILKKYRQNSIKATFKIVFVTPYITEQYKKKIDYMNNICDEIIYPPIENVPPKFSILKRNQWMVKKCDIVITYIDHSFGGAYKTYKFAKKFNKQIINLTKFETIQH